MKKNKKYLPLYRKWLKSGLQTEGLCGFFYGDPLFELINPEHGYDFFWGYDGMVDNHTHVHDEQDLFYGFTPIRQNVVLLMAAMNGEL